MTELASITVHMEAALRATVEGRDSDVDDELCHLAALGPKALISACVGWGTATAYVIKVSQGQAPGIYTFEADGVATDDLQATARTIARVITACCNEDVKAAADLLLAIDNVADVFEVIRYLLINAAAALRWLDAQQAKR